MFFSVCLISVLSFFSANVQANAQELRENSAAEQELRRRALVIDIDARVLTDDLDVIWNEIQRKIAIPGSSVGLRLIGSNVVVGVQFTPIVHNQGNVLIAHVQIWMDNPGSGVSYHTSLQTIPIDFNEQIYFFPLGATNSSIEILLTINPYSVISALEGASSSTNNGN